MSFRVGYEHRDELRQAALAEFCERGYDAASINRILATAGMSKGQFYHHFNGKWGLYRALVEWMIDQKADWNAQRVVEPGEDFVATLGQHIRASLEFVGAHPDVEGFSRAVLSEPNQSIFACVTEEFAFTPDSTLAELVAQGHHRAQFNPGLTLDFVQRAVLFVVNHAPELLDLAQPADLDHKLEELLAFLRTGLAR